jgi:hypothetical protein
MTNMKHPDTGQEIEVKDDQADTYRSQGWTVVEPEPESEPEPEPEQQSSPSKSKRK